MTSHGFIPLVGETRERVRKFPRLSIRTHAALWVLAGLALTLSVTGARADAEPSRVGDYEIGLQTAYSFGITNNAQMVTFFPRVGRVVAVTAGTVPGIVTFGVEGMFSRVFETQHGMELGGGLLLRYRWAAERLQPYAEIGGAMLYTDLRHFDLSSHVLFAAQGAVGLQVPLAGQLALTAGYRFRHISNAGQSRINPGLNSNLLAAGFAYEF